MGYPGVVGFGRRDYPGNRTRGRLSAGAHFVLRGSYCRRLLFRNGGLSACGTLAGTASSANIVTGRRRTLLRTGGWLPPQLRPVCHSHGGSGDTLDQAAENARHGVRGAGCYVRGPTVGLQLHKISESLRTWPSVPVVRQAQRPRRPGEPPKPQPGESPARHLHPCAFAPLGVAMLVSSIHGSVVGGSHRTYRVLCAVRSALWWGQRRGQAGLDAFHDLRYVRLRTLHPGCAGSSGLRCRAIRRGLRARACAALLVPAGGPVARPGSIGQSLGGSVPACCGEHCTLLGGFGNLDDCAAAPLQCALPLGACSTARFRWWWANPGTDSQGQTLGQTASFRQTAPETWCQSRVCGVLPVTGGTKIEVFLSRGCSKLKAEMGR